MSVKNFKDPYGNRWSYRFEGDPGGWPVLFLHGMPGSMDQAFSFLPHLKEAGVRLITLDRVGYGKSELQQPLNFEQAGISLLGLLDQEGIKNFSVLAVSGGGPYAWALAKNAGDRVTSLGLVCAVVPFSGRLKRQWALSHRLGLPLSSKLGFKGTSLIIKSALKVINPAERLNLLSLTQSDVDRKVIQNPEVTRMMADQFVKAGEHDYKGMAHDIHFYSQPWLEETKNYQRPLYFWHGEQDRLLPVGFSKEFSKNFPQSQLKIYPEDGHYSLPIQRAQDILMDFKKSW